MRITGTRAGVLAIVVAAGAAWFDSSTVSGAPPPKNIVLTPIGVYLPTTSMGGGAPSDLIVLSR